MKREGSDFVYAIGRPARINAKAFRYRVPGDIIRRDELFAALEGALWLSERFRSDWDTLYDCLCDFSWMSDRRIVLVHESLPRLPDADLTVYLSILRDAVRWWRLDEPHVLAVVFPQAQRDRIEALLGPV